MRAFAYISSFALLSGVALCQSADTPTTFELSEIRTVPPKAQQFMRGGLLRGGRYELRDATMVDLIKSAYGVEDDNVIGGPSWLESDRFDVVAKTKPNASADSLKEMLKALLADRFKLVTHPDTKPLPQFVLSVGKGKHKLKESDGTGEKGCQGQPPPPNQAPGAPRYNVVTCRNMTLEAIAQELTQMAGAYLTNPVLDRTDIKGSWDFDLKWTSRGQLSAAGADGITIFDAVERQLGLKLELQKVPLPVVVVDSVNRKPSPNAEDVSKSLPPPVTEFEVAAVKPSGPDSRQQRSPFQPGGKLEVMGISLQNLIAVAWTLNGPEMLVGAPKWLDSEKFDIIAKASSASLLHGPANAPPMDIDTLRLMLRSLLIERFKLQVHYEERPLPAYNLVATKPKLTKADPTERTKFKEGPAAANARDPRDKNPLLGRLVTCTNMSMAEFAAQLQNIAPGYIHSPVLDETGLEGGYTFTVSFSPMGVFQPGGGERRGGGDGAPAAANPDGASDPNGAITLPEAIEKQLGLKLEKKTRPVPVLVIDHIEQKPVDN